MCVLKLTALLRASIPHATVLWEQHSLLPIGPFLGHNASCRARCDGQNPSAISPAARVLCNCSQETNCKYFALHFKHRRCWSEHVVHCCFGQFVAPTHAGAAMNVLCGSVASHRWQSPDFLHSHYSANSALWAQTRTACVHAQTGHAACAPVTAVALIDCNIHHLHFKQLFRSRSTHLKDA